MDNKDTNATLRRDARMWLGFVVLPAVFAVAIVAGVMIFVAGIHGQVANANVAMAVGALVVAAGGVGIALSWAATSHNVGMPARESEQIGEDGGSSPHICDPQDLQWTPEQLEQIRSGGIRRDPFTATLDATLGNAADLVRMLDERLTEMRYAGGGPSREWLHAAVDLRNLAEALGVIQPTFLGIDADTLDDALRDGEYLMPDEG